MKRENSRAGEPEQVGAGCFWLLGAGAAKKFAGSPALEFSLFMDKSI